jgi:protein-disulfide isomerase
MHRRLFENQRAFGDEALAEAGASVGIEAQTFKRCLDGEMRDRITDDVAEGLRLRVSATPTFFVGIVQTDGSIQLRKRVSGTVSFDDLRQMIDAVRAMTHPSS